MRASLSQVAGDEEPASHGIQVCQLPPETWLRQEVHGAAGMQACSQLWQAVFTVAHVALLGWRSACNCMSDPCFPLIGIRQYNAATHVIDLVIKKCPRASMYTTMHQIPGQAHSKYACMACKYLMCRNRAGTTNTLSHRNVSEDFCQLTNTAFHISTLRQHF